MSHSLQWDVAKVNKDTDQKGSIWLLLYFHFFLMYMSPGRTKVKNMNKERETETWKYEKYLYKRMLQKIIGGGQG